MRNQSENWETVIEPYKRLFSINLKEVWQYRDLLRMLIKRDFVTYYKQTILGPMWFLIQPIFTTVIYMFVFGQIANISTDGLPHILFYMAGITSWNYFADCLNKTSTVFKDNQNVFGKVYFPRLIVPLSIVASNMIKFGIQFLLFLSFLLYYLVTTNLIVPNLAILLTPILLIMMAGLGLGFGMLITSLTTKYRDLVFLLQFSIQLLMYATPVIYPLSSIPKQYEMLILANPMTGLIETFRFAFLGSGYIDWKLLIYDGIFTLTILFIGMLIFNRTEKNFMDTV